MSSNSYRLALGCYYKFGPPKNEIASYAYVENTLGIELLNVTTLRGVSKNINAVVVCVEYCV